MRLRLWHKLTAHHWRHDRRSRNTLAICSCGWKCRMFRAVEWYSRLRRPLCLAGHAWGATEQWHVGPVGFDESEDTLTGRTRQCDRCWKIEDLP